MAYLSTAQRIVNEAASMLRAGQSLCVIVVTPIPGGSQVTCAASADLNGDDWSAVLTKMAGAVPGRGH